MKSTRAALLQQNTYHLVFLTHNNIRCMYLIDYNSNINIRHTTAYTTLQFYLHVRTKEPFFFTFEMPCQHEKYQNEMTE